MGSLTSRKTELTEKCKAEFECDIKEAKELGQQFDKAAEDALCDAEKILGLREGEPSAETPEEPEAAPATKRPVRRPVMDTTDEDSLV